MAIKINIDNFGYFAFTPSSPLLSKRDQKTALALSILMGVTTLGVGHLISSIVYVIKKEEMTKLLATIQSTYNSNLGKSNVVNNDENFLEEYAPSFKANFNHPQKQINNCKLQHMLLRTVKIKNATDEGFSTVLAQIESSSQIFVLQKRDKLSEKGNFGTVKLAQNLTTGKFCAVKITRENINASDAYKEMRLKTPEQELQGLKAFNMLEGSAYRVDLTKQQHVFYLFMKYFPGSSLNKIAPENLDYRKLVEIAISALHSLNEFHAKGYLHRDIKKENFIHNDSSDLPILDRTSLIDFGSSMPVDSNGEVIVEDSFGMTDALSSWKQSDQKFHLSQYTDMFSMGNVFYDLFNNIQNYKQQLEETLSQYDKILQKTDKEDTKTIEAIDCQKKKLVEKLNEINSSELWHDILQVIKKMSPDKDSYSKITAADALAEFQAIHQKHWTLSE